MNILGVDPGKTGGLIIISAESGRILNQMPNIESPLDVYHFIKPYCGVLFAYVEKAQAMPKNGAVSMFNYGQGFGEILGVLTALEVPFELVPPATWTRSMLAGVPTSYQGKKRAALAVQRLYPSTCNQLYASHRSRKLHEGLVDALLLAEYGRRRQQSDPVHGRYVLHGVHKDEEVIEVSLTSSPSLPGSPQG